MDAHVDLSCAQLQPILDAPALAFRRNGKQQLARAIGEAAWWFRLHQDIEQSRLVPSRDARRARAAASALDQVFELLTEENIPRDDLMAWAGFEADEENPPAPGAPSGFERAANVVEQIRWLRDRLQSWARRTQTLPPGRSGRRDLTGARLKAPIGPTQNPEEPERRFRLSCGLIEESLDRDPGRPDGSRWHCGSAGDCGTRMPSA